MLQFYFLSILLNILSGLVLFYSRKDEDEDDDLTVLEGEGGEQEVKKSGSIFQKFFGRGSVTDDEMFYLVLGVLSVFTAVIKLLSAVNGIAIFGDLIPAVAGFLGGASILIMYFQMRSTVSIDMNETLQFILVESRKIIGIACIVVAVVHFIFPGALFL